MAQIEANRLKHSLLNRELAVSGDFCFFLDLSRARSRTRVSVGTSFLYAPRKGRQPSLFP